MDAPTPGRPPSSGRRGNGLASADWGALVDLDPRLSEGLLDRLASAGVPAYVEPAVGSTDAVSRATALPDRPLDRLWVDPGRAEEARQVVGAEVADLSALLGETEPGATAHGLVQPVPRTAARRVLTPPPLPDPPPRAPEPVAPAEASAEPAAPEVPEAPADPRAGEVLDDEEQWRRIVEGYDRSPDVVVPPWPVEEDVDPGPRRSRLSRPQPPSTDDGGSTRRPMRRRTDRPQPAEDALPGWVEPEAIEDPHHFVPPPAPPVPRVHPRKLVAAVAVILGILLVFAPGLLGQGETMGSALLGLMLTAAGAGALVWWMRDAPPTDSGPDDGAIV